MGTSKKEYQRQWESVSKEWDKIIAQAIAEVSKWKRAKERDRSHYRNLISNAK